MSLDGSFTCKSALERFLARCPKLQSNLRFLKILQKGEAMTDDEVVNLLAEPLLHPNYTIRYLPLFGCFHPLVSKIVSLLRRVLGLEKIDYSDGTDGNDKEEISQDDIHVIKFYMKSWRVFRLHEIASLSFCRVLDLAPFTRRNSCTCICKSLVSPIQNCGPFYGSDKQSISK